MTVTEIVEPSENNLVVLESSSDYENELFDAAKPVDKGPGDLLNSETFGESNQKVGHEHESGAIHYHDLEDVSSIF